jgi:hypothetical protein
MGMLETIAAGLTVALVTGVTIIAYKHPQAYRKYYNPMDYIVLAVFSARVLYSVAFTNGFLSAMSGVRDLNKGALVQTPPYPSDSILALFVTNTGSPVLAVLVVLARDSRVREKQRNAITYDLSCTLMRSTRVKTNVALI